jgi:hypothetical protein
MGNGCCLFRLQFVVEKPIEEDYTARFSISSIVLCMSIAEIFYPDTYPEHMTPTNYKDVIDNCLRIRCSSPHWLIKLYVTDQYHALLVWKHMMKLLPFFILRFYDKTLPGVTLLLFFVTCTMWDNGTSM